MPMRKLGNIKNFGPNAPVNIKLAQRTEERREERALAKAKSEHALESPPAPSDRSEAQALRPTAGSIRQLEDSSGLPPIPSNELTPSADSAMEQTKTA